MKDEILAWHFVGKTLRNGDPIPEDGVPLIFEGELVICEIGLHASKNILDALRYAPGNTICRVKCSAIGERHNDKFVAAERTIIWRIDGEEILRKFARRIALDVIHLWNAPSIVRQYLETGDETIRAAAKAAAKADAAWDAAWDAALAAAWAAGAAEAAAGAAGAVGAAGAARDAAQAKYNDWLIEMIEEARIK